MQTVKLQLVSIWLSIHANTMWSMCLCVCQRALRRVERLFSFFFFAISLSYHAFMSLCGMFIEAGLFPRIYQRALVLLLAFHSWLMGKGTWSRTERQETSVPGSWICPRITCRFTSENWCWRDVCLGVYSNTHFFLFYHSSSCISFCVWSLLLV